MALALAALAARPAHAQSRLAATLALEGGYVHGGEYRRDTPKTMALAHLDLRVARWHGAAVLAGLAFEEPFGPNAITAVCEIGSHGQCLDPPPDVRSFTATLGVRRMWANRIALGVNGGIGEVADRRWGALQGAITGEFDLALRIAGPVSLTGGGRVVGWRLHGVSLHSYTQAYGIRIN